MTSLARLNSAKIYFHFLADFSPQKKYILGLGPGSEPKPKPITKIISEFNFIHFGEILRNQKTHFILRNQKTFKIFDTHKFLGLKNVRKI